MSDEKSAEPLAMPTSMEQFAEMLSAGIAAGIAKNSPPKKVTFGEYTRRQNIGRSKLKRACFQNYLLLDANLLSNEEIDLLNKVSHTGRYIDRLVEVVIRDEGADEVLELRYNNRTIDQRFALSRHVRDFTDMLTQITAAQKIEREEEAQWQAERPSRPTQRHFGDNKATREARTKAGV